MANTFTLIASSTVGSGGASSIDFTSIPSTYTDLCFLTSTRTTSVAQGDVVNIAFNNSTANISARVIYGDSPNAVSTTSTSWGFWTTSNGATANTFANSMVYIPNYASSNNKSWSTDSVTENNGGAYSLLLAGLWSNSAAINRITFTAVNGNFVQYSTAYLYGIKNS